MVGLVESTRILKNRLDVVVGVVDNQKDAPVVVEAVVVPSGTVGMNSVMVSVGAGDVVTATVQAEKTVRVVGVLVQTMSWFSSRIRTSRLGKDIFRSV